MAKRDGLAFAAGLASGMVAGMDRKQRREREEEDRKMRRDEHDARVAERQRVEGDRVALANAARPVEIEEGAGGMIRPESMDNRDVGLPENQSQPNGGLQAAPFRVAGQTFTDRAAAQSAAEKANSPEEQDKRIALAMKERGNVLGAKQFEASSRQAQVSAMDLAERQWGKKIRGALESGHEGLAELITSSEGGPFAGKRVKAVPTEDGKQVVYHKLNEDGSSTPLPHLTFTNDQEGVARAGYMLDRSVTPEARYKNMVAEDKQAAAVAAKEKELELRKRQLEEVQIPNAETSAQLAEVRAEIAKARAGRGSDGVSREERLRYTTLFTDAGRRMQDSQKAMNTMRQDRSFMRRAATPGTPEAQQFEEARQQLAEHQQERELYRGLLSSGKSDGGKGKGEGEGGGKQPGLSEAKPGNGAPKPAASAPQQPVKVGTKAERDKLPKGARYIGPDGQTYIKQ